MPKMKSNGEWIWEEVRINRNDIIVINTDEKAPKKDEKAP